MRQLRDELRAGQVNHFLFNIIFLFFLKKNLKFIKFFKFLNFFFRKTASDTADLDKVIFHIKYIIINIHKLNISFHTF